MVKKDIFWGVISEKDKLDKISSSSDCLEVMSQDLPQFLFFILVGGLALGETRKLLFLATFVISSGQYILYVAPK